MAGIVEPLGAGMIETGHSGSDADVEAWIARKAGVETNARRPDAVQAGRNTPDRPGSRRSVARQADRTRFPNRVDGTLNTGDDEETRGTDQALIQIATELSPLAFWEWVSEIITPFGAGMWSIWEGTIVDYDEYGPWGPPTELVS